MARVVEFVCNESFRLLSLQVDLVVSNLFVDNLRRWSSFLMSDVFTAYDKLVRGTSPKMKNVIIFKALLVLSIISSWSGQLGSFPFS